MNTPEKDTLWLRYVNLCWTGATRKERRSAFNAWLRAEQKDIEHQTKRRRAKALSGK